MPAPFTPILKVGPMTPPTDSNVYIHVRITDEPRPDGYMLVYLPNGTALEVNANQLLHLTQARTVPIDRGVPSFAGGGTLVDIERVPIQAGRPRGLTSLRRGPQAPRRARFCAGAGATGTSEADAVAPS